MVKLLKLVHPEKACCETVPTPLGMVTPVKLEQFMKAAQPTVVTLLGSATSVRRLH